MISTEQYTEIVRVLPILCVDVVVMNTNGEYLLVKRANEPRKGHWWVIGGRVFRGETMEQAAIRKVKEEVGLDARSFRPIGYYEEVFGKNPFGLASELHAVSIVFSAVVDGCQPVKLDSQSADWQYSSELPPDFHIRSFGKYQLAELP